MNPPLPRHWNRCRSTHTVIDLIVVDSATGNRLAVRTSPSPSTCSPAAWSAWSSRWKPVRRFGRPVPRACRLRQASLAGRAERGNGLADGGKPRLLYPGQRGRVQSEALRRGCEQHGIRLDYRPLGQPHYGGIVERIIGTAMQMIHDELPGTTFSNPDQRGSTILENKAALTLRVELERWLTLAVGTYHGSVQRPAQAAGARCRGR